MEWSKILKLNTGNFVINHIAIVIKARAKSGMSK